MRSFGLCFLAAILISTGCAGPVYRDAFQEERPYHMQQFKVSSSCVFRAAVKVILSKSFIVENEDQAKGTIVAKKSYKKGSKTIAIVLQTRIIEDDPETSTVYLNAIETQERCYVADRTRYFLFLIPLPGGGGKEASQIKEGERTIEDKVFYKNFFDAIKAELDKKAKQTIGLPEDRQKSSVTEVQPVLEPVSKASQPESQKEPADIQPVASTGRISENKPSGQQEDK